MPADPHPPTCDALDCLRPSGAMLRVLDREALANGYPAVVVLCSDHLAAALPQLARSHVNAEVTPWP